MKAMQFRFWSISVLLVASSILTNQSADATNTNVWISLSSGRWDTATNWSFGIPPGLPSQSYITLTNGFVLPQTSKTVTIDSTTGKVTVTSHRTRPTELEITRYVLGAADSAEADGKVVFLHKIVEGGADKSYGIHVAQLAGLPAPVIQRANEIMLELEKTSGRAVNINSHVAQQAALFPETSPLLDELGAHLAVHAGPAGQPEDQHALRDRLRP